MPDLRLEDDLTLRALVLTPDRELVARLREMLFAVGGVELLGSAASAAELLAQIRQQQPDLLLLDSDRLPIESDAALRAWAAAGRGVAAVALTAQPEQAPGGLPALRRPPTLEATRSLLDDLRADARDHVERRGPAIVGAAASAPTPYLRRLLVRSPGHVRLLPVEEVLWIDAVHNAVKLHTAQGEFRLRQSIAALVAQLDPARFVRIHRSTVVQLDAVREFRVNARGQYSAVMPGGARLTVSRSYHDALLQRLRER